MKTLLDYAKEIAAFCAHKRPDHECIFALTHEGELLKSEEIGQGNSFQGDLAEQIQFRGNTPPQEIYARLRMRASDEVNS